MNDHAAGDLRRNPHQGYEANRPLSLETVDYDAFREGIRSRMLRELLVYWNGRRKQGSPPCRRDVDPIDIPRHLPNLYILESPEPDIYRFRLAGTGVREIFAHEPTGMFLSECLPEQDLERALRSYRRLLDAGTAWYSQNTYLRDGGEPYLYERLSLALATPEGQPRQIVGAFELDHGHAAGFEFAECFISFEGLADRREMLLRA